MSIVEIATHSSRRRPRRAAVETASPAGHQPGTAPPTGHRPGDERPSGRAWINGREVGGTDPRLRHLAVPYD